MVKRIELKKKTGKFDGKTFSYFTIDLTVCWLEFFGNELKIKSLLNQIYCEGGWII